MELIISKSVVVTLVRMDTCLTLVERVLMKTLDHVLPDNKSDDVIWNNFVKRISKFTSETTMFTHKVLTRKKTIDSEMEEVIFIDLDDQWVIDTIEMGGDLIASTLKMIYGLNQNRYKSYGDKWFPNKDKELE